MTEKLRSKLDYKVFLLGLFFLPGFVFPVITFYRKVQEGFTGWEPMAKELLVPFSLLTVAAIIYWYYRTSVPQIIITQNHFQFGERIISFNQIRKIDVLAKGFLTFEKSIIYLKQNEEIHLAISLYQNGPLLRKNLSLVQEKLDGKIQLQIPVFQPTAIKPEKLKEPLYIRKFKQSIFRNSFLYYAIALSGMFIFLSIRIAVLPVSLILLLPLLPIGYILFNQYFYFLVSEEHITVKNFFMPWYQKTYRKSNIILARKYWGAKGADGVKLIFSDYSTKVFQSHLLSDKMLQDLISELNINHLHTIK